MCNTKHYFTRPSILHASSISSSAPAVVNQSLVALNTSTILPFLGTASRARARTSLIPTFVATDDVQRFSSFFLPWQAPGAWSETSRSIRSRRSLTSPNLLSMTKHSFSISLVLKDLSSSMVSIFKLMAAAKRDYMPKRINLERRLPYIQRQFSTQRTVEVQDLKQIPGSWFPLLAHLIAMTLYPHPHAFTLTGEGLRIIASASYIEDIARGGELTLALPVKKS